MANIYQEESIGAIVRKLENNFITGTTTKSKYVDESLYEDINKIEAYLNSKHVSGDVDSMGREKPFFNIVTASRNIWYRATDIDRKNIKFKPSKSSDIFPAFAATEKLQTWMRKENFGAFLNDWGITQAGYNEAVLKFVEKDGRLIPSVIPWTRIICDSIDFENNPKIEILEFTEGQLYQMEGYDQDEIERLCDTRKVRETVGRQNKDNNADYVKLYEVHGLFPKSLRTGQESDEDIYEQQMFVLSFVSTGKNKGEYEDFVLYAGKEEKDPYMLTALMREIDGSISLKGSVKTLFEAQWMVNHSMKAIKDHLDLASKLIFQTSDGNFVGQNALTAIETGDILIHSPNEPLTQMNNSSHDITSLQNFGSQWKALAQEIASTPDALMGNNAPSGTAWRQVEALQSEANSLFELMTENRGLDIERMMREFVIPYIKKGLNSKEEIVALLEDYDIKKIDSRFIKNKATKITNQQIVEKILNDERPTPEDQALLQSINEKGLEAALKENGNTRFFVPSEVDDKTWADVFKDFEWNIIVDVTGESQFNREDLATLSTVFSTIGSNPAVLTDPNAKLLFNKILSITGAVSPIELAPSEAPMQPQAPQQPMQMPTPMTG